MEITVIHNKIENARFKASVRSCEDIEVLFTSIDYPETHHIPDDEMTKLVAMNPKILGPATKKAISVFLRKTLQKYEEDVCNNGNTNSKSDY